MKTNKASTLGRKRKSKPVGRPRKSGSSTKDSASEEILKVAAALFSSKGYAGTNMAEIADTVGIRGPSLYYHFESKSEILRAIADLGMVGTIQSAAKLRDEATLTPAARLYQLIDEVVLLLRSSDYAFNCLYDPAFQDKEFSDINKRLVAWMKDVERIVADGVRSDQLITENTELTTYTIRGMLALSVRELAHFKQLSPEQVARYVADFALTAILKNKSTLKSIYKELEAYNAATEVAPVP